jgi:hypothetical protein
MLLDRQNPSFLLCFSYMGSIVEINDTLQITRKQGFPEDLNYDKHQLNPLKAEDFAERIFEFKDKSKIRLFQQAPVRNFLAENRDGKWIYWGLVHILEVTHDHVKQTTSGKFKIVYIYTPQEMLKAYDIMDRRPETKFPG